MTAFEAARTHMIESQLRPNKVTDERVLAAFAQLRRELFVPEHLRAVAYIDDDLPLGCGRYLMEPMVAARLLQAVSVERTDSALVVGAGAGYEAAVLGLLARAVVAIEEDERLARLARAALVDHRVASVKVVEGPLAEGCRASAPYDVILFAGAAAEVPERIVAQLADGGRLAAIIRTEGSVGRAVLMSRAGTVIARRTIFDAATPVLPGLRQEPAFVF
ncbi:MAG TPA: protein-L-isoaspartate O-methyltransferase [Stellaceae bacterium]|jgi:protein-L-isoaspartate(D-aspartate) O-methyltransferase